MKRSYLSVSIIAIIMSSLVGCGTSHQAVNLESGFQSKANMKVEVGKVTNVTGKEFGEVDVVAMFKDCFTERLQKQNLLSEDPKGQRLIFDTKITEYEPGNAFKRWLLPGYGSTILGVNCDMKDAETGKLIGTIDARRTVSMGGGYTIGAWRTIVGEVADDVVSKLKQEVVK
jgi:hypothetical protein